MMPISRYILIFVIALSGCASQKIHTSGLDKNEVTTISASQNLFNLKAPVIILNVDGTALEQLKSGSFEVRPGFHDVTVGIFRLYASPIMVRHISFNTETGKKYTINYKDNDDSTVSYIVREENSGKVVFKDGNKPINELPMYGSPDHIKTPEQERIDKEFIKSVVKSEGSREIAAKKFAAAGWLAKQKGDKATSIKRFNQSWLLDPNYYQPYWGFAALMLDEKKPEKASIYFERAISLINDDNEKARLFVDAAKAYGWQASMFKDRDIEKSITMYNKANALVDQAMEVDPKYSNSYRIGGIIAYNQADYDRAWAIVRKSRESGAYLFDEEFIKNLTKAYPEP